MGWFSKVIAAITASAELTKAIKGGTGRRDDRPTRRLDPKKSPLRRDPPKPAA